MRSVYGIVLAGVCLATTPLVAEPRLGEPRDTPVPLGPAALDRVTAGTTCFGGSACSHFDPAPVPGSLGGPSVPTPGPVTQASGIGFGLGFGAGFGTGILGGGGNETCSGPGACGASSAAASTSQ